MNIKFKIVVLCLASNLIIAQNGNMSKKEVKQLKSLGKQAIVELALKRLGEGVDTSYFKSIKVMASDRDVYVSFDNPIKFVPENSVYYYNTVVFINGVMSRGPLQNPENKDFNKDKIHYFKYDAEVLKEIKFVIKAMNKQEIVDTINWKYYKDNNGMIIYDRGEYYEVNASYGKFNEAAYKVDKSTGVVTEEYHADILPDPNSRKVKYIEMKN